MTDRTADMMQAIASAIDKGLNGEGEPKRVAFVVLTANFNEIEGGKVNYISNAERSDMKAILKELLARWEGRYDTAPEQRQ